MYIKVYFLSNKISSKYPGFWIKNGYPYNTNVNDLIKEKINMYSYTLLVFAEGSTIPTFLQGAKGVQMVCTLIEYLSKNSNYYQRLIFFY